MGQNFPVIQSEESFQLRDPVVHRHRHAALRLRLGKDKVLLHEVVQGAEFCLVKIVLRNGHVRFTNAGTLPIRQPHVRQSPVGSGEDDLGGGLAVDGVVGFVLHRGEEGLRQRVLFFVINAGEVDVRDLLVKPPLAGVDVLDAAGHSGGCGRVHPISDPDRRRRLLWPDLRGL